MYSHTVIFDIERIHTRWSVVSRIKALEKIDIYLKECMRARGEYIKIIFSQVFRELKKSTEESLMSYISHKYMAMNDLLLEDMNDLLSTYAIGINRKDRADYLKCILLGEAYHINESEEKWEILLIHEINAYINYRAYILIELNTKFEHAIRSYNHEAFKQAESNISNLMGQYKANRSKKMPYIYIQVKLSKYSLLDVHKSVSILIFMCKKLMYQFKIYTTDIYRRLQIIRQSANSSTYNDLHVRIELHLITSHKYFKRVIDSYLSDVVFACIVAINNANCVLQFQLLDEILKVSKIKGHCDILERYELRRAFE